MPDPHRTSVSSSEVAALFGRSPYMTRWMLYHRMRGAKVEEPENARMSWGTKMEPLILEQAAEELALRVIPNYGRRYSRRGHLGCTRDATIIDPSRGPGTLEVKSVFDYKQWMEKWDGGATPPDHIYLQAQLQMAVGNYRNGAFKWGKIAAWVCGELQYFDIEPEPDMWNDMEAEAAALVRDVHAGKEPDPAGEPVELPWLTRFFPFNEKAVVDLRNERPERIGEIINAALDYEEAKKLCSVNDKLAERCKARLLALAQGAATIMLPGDIYVDIKSWPVAGGALGVDKKNAAAAVDVLERAAIEFKIKESTTATKLSVRCPPDAQRVTLTQSLAEILNAG